MADTDRNPHDAAQIPALSPHRRRTCKLCRHTLCRHTYTSQSQPQFPSQPSPSHPLPRKFNNFRPHPTHHHRGQHLWNDIIYPRVIALPLLLQILDIAETPSTSRPPFHLLIIPRFIVAPIPAKIRDVKSTRLPITHLHIPFPRPPNPAVQINITPLPYHPMLQSLLPGLLRPRGAGRTVNSSRTLSSSGRPPTGPPRA